MKKESTSTSGTTSKKSSQKKPLRSSTTKKRTVKELHSSRKKKEDQRKGCVWGDQRTKLGRKRFYTWLKNLKDAKGFLKDDGSLYVYENLSGMHKPLVAKKLRKVDLKGYKEIIARITNRTRQKIKAKEVLPEEVIKEDAMLVEVEKLTVPATSLVKFVDHEGIKGVLALCLASGNSVEDVSEMCKISIAEINQMVDGVDIQRALRRMPEAVASLADQVVMRDLLDGKVTEATARADLISARRRKIAIDAHKEGRASIPSDRKQLEAKEKKVANRFGVDRAEGKIIDVEEEK